MQCTTKKLPKGMVEIACEAGLEDIRKDLDRAAAEISKEKPIQGYRPGKAPYDVVKQRFGEMAIYEAALPDVVRRVYVKAVVDGNIRTFGEPQINVTRLAPGNPISFTASVAVVPAITSLADFRKLKVVSKPKAVEEKSVDEALGELRKMQTKEVRVEREAKAGDKIVLDMDLSQSGVPLDGGQARDHSVYLDESYYVPGMKEQVLGLKAGDKKRFTLKFPDTHYQKHLAGRDVDFDVTVKEVFELQHPALDDAFAKTVGQETMDGLRSLIRKNMETEAKEKEAQRAELELLEKIVDKSKFEEVPDAIVGAEVDRMLHELKHGVNERGIEFEEYLRNIKKSIDDLRLEFSSQAIKRIKTAIVVREIGEKEGILATDEEVMGEVQKLMNSYAHDAESQERIRSEEYQDYLRTTIRNKKVLEMLRKEAVEEK
jgi:trigger factor